MDEILDFLAARITDPLYTDAIGERFSDILLLIVTKCFPFAVDTANLHQKRCIALAKLIKYSPEVQRYVLCV